MKNCLETYLRMCRPFRLPEPWSCLKAERTARRGPAVPSMVLTKLRKKCDERSLLDSGLLIRDGADELKLNPHLDSPDVGVLPLRNSRGEVYDLLTEQGCVVGRQAPFVEILEDELTARCSADGTRSLFLTEKFVDIVLLRSLGYAAAPLTGVEGLNQAGLNLLRRKFGITLSPFGQEAQEQMGAERSGTEAHASSQSSHVRLTIVNWLPHSLERSESSRAVQAIELLTQFERHRGLDLSELDVWRPSTRDIEELRFAMSRRERAWIDEAFRNSLFRCCGALIGLKPDPDEISAPTNLAEAIELVDRMAARTGDDAGRKRLQEALRYYAAAIGKALIGPLMQQGEALPDPVDRILHFQMAKLTTLFFNLAPSVKTQILQLTSLGSGELTRFDKALEDLLAISGQLVTLTKETRKCKRRQVASKNRKARTIDVNPGASPRFKISDLAARN